MRVLAVDHGEKRIGLAISDVDRTLARPLTVIEHVSRAVDAARVVECALREEVAQIVIGQSFDEEGLPSAAGRRAVRFAEILKGLTEIPIAMWDESLSTQDARARRIASGVSRKRRASSVDALAAAVILQSYLDAHQPPANDGRGQ